MKSAVTQNDVAKEAGVTRSMVSYVISGNSDRSVAPETRKRILDAIERLGYRPNKAAQALQQGDVGFAANKIGVVLCTSETFLRPYYAEILSGIHIEAHEQNFQVSFIRFFHELKNPVLFNSLIHEEEIGGLILVATDQCLKTDEDKKIIAKIKERLSKIVCVEFQYEGLSSVMFDRQATAQRATEYLIQKGFSEIGYIGEVDDRVHGVQLALSEKNLDAKRDNFFIAETFDMSGGFNAIDSFPADKKIPRAIVCGSDEVAIGVLRGLSKKNISVPNDVAIISIDNIEYSEYTCPPLTTMNVQKKAMGEQAVKMIVSGTAGKDECALKIMLPSSLIVRESC